MNIDWSKAPEGATHKDLKYAPTGFWYKFDFQNDTAAYCLHGQKVWVRSGKASEYNDGSMNDMTARPSAKEQADQLEKTRQEIIDLIWRECGAQGDMIRQLATTLVSHGYRKFEIVEDDV